MNAAEPTRIGQGCPMIRRVGETQYACGAFLKACYDTGLTDRNTQLPHEMRHFFRLLSIAGLLGFLSLSGRTYLNRIVNLGRPNSLDSQLTTNNFLRILGVDEPAPRMERALNAFSPDEHLLLVAPASEPFAGQVYLTLSYLSYPRRLSAVFCIGPQQGRTEGPPISAIDGFLFFETRPENPGRSSASIGAKMTIVRRRSTAPWRSFCR